MNEPFEFEVGPPDDAADEALMRIGIASRKAALKSYQKLNSIVQDFGSEFGERKKTAYCWQGMISLAAYSVLLTRLMLKDRDINWQEEGVPTLPYLTNQVEDIATKFLARIEDQDE